MPGGAGWTVRRDINGIEWYSEVLGEWYCWEHGNYGTGQRHYGTPTFPAPEQRRMRNDT